MGKTVPSYRMAVEFEIGRWKGFRNALANDEEKLAFDQVMDMVRGLASAGSCACDPIIFEPMAMSILVLQQKKMRHLETELDDLLWQRSGEKKAIVKIQTSENKPDNVGSSVIMAFTRGIKISKINAKLKDTIDITPLLGKFQQLGFLKIIYNSAMDDEPLVQITEKGKQQAIELLRALQPIDSSLF